MHRVANTWIVDASSVGVGVPPKIVPSETGTALSSTSDTRPCGLGIFFPRGILPILSLRPSNSGGATSTRTPLSRQALSMSDSITAHPMFVPSKGFFFVERPLHS